MTNARRRRPLLVLLATALGFFVLLQAVRPDRTNPPVDPANKLESHLTVPRDVASILDRSCRDCHTNETRWPWYSHVAPASLLLARDVREARDQMNFSEWGDYDAETADEHLHEICEEIREGAMPLPPYTWLHPESKLSSRDVEVLCAWTRKARAEVKARAEEEEEE